MTKRGAPEEIRTPDLQIPFNALHCRSTATASVIPLSRYGDQSSKSMRFSTTILPLSFLTML
jgi:hypothetical protein